MMQRQRRSEEGGKEYWTEYHGVMYNPNRFSLSKIEDLEVLKARIDVIAGIGTKKS